MNEEQNTQPEPEQFDVLLDDIETGIRPRKIKAFPKKQKSSGSGWQYAGLAGQIGFDVAMPMVLGLVVGTKLDERWGTRPKATLLLFFIGLSLSCASLIRIVKDVLNKR